MPSKTLHLPLPLSFPRTRLALLGLAMLSGCASGPSSTMPVHAHVHTPASALPGGGSAPPQAPLGGEADETRRFAQWLENFRAKARAAGIDESTLQTALKDVRLRHRAVEQDRSQPEFTRTFWEYLESAITPQRISTGQQKLAQFNAEAQAATMRHGVPGPILAAIWGIESNFGGNYGDVPVFDALATLGFEGRREAWAQSELLAALKIAQRGDIEPARMIGSWAGAMGQTQFMPSSYLAFAVDADGDGRRDLWGSMADVLASTAHYLARNGWREGETWGTEVRLPDGFDPSRADPSLRQTSAQWGAEGVKPIDGGPLPPLADASILLPAGARGPAFIVGNNFRSILRYNNSTSYALTVSLLAQQIAGGPGVQAPWPRELRALTRGEMQALQTALNRRGFDSGVVDGQMGPATRNALRAYQKSIGVPADGYPTEALLRRLQQE